jgi:hypothetical protein
MVTHLGDWYRAAGMEPNSETLPKHGAAIEEYDPTPAQVISLTRLFYGFLKQDDLFLDDFRKSFQAKDPAFPMRDNMLQMAVLAGASLIQLIKHGKDEQLADLAALCMVSAAAQGLRAVPPVPEMPEIAARYLEERPSKRVSLGVDKDEKDTESRLGKLRSELALVSEETDMLWWLVSESSRDLKKTWKEIGLPATAIVAGKELADLTRIIPGPVAAIAFLDRIVRISNSGKSPKAVKVKEAIEKTPRNWLEQNMPEPTSAGLKDLLPITNGVKLSLTVDEGGEWSSVFEKGTAIKDTSKILPSALAYQLFLERMVSIQLGEIE